VSDLTRALDTFVPPPRAGDAAAPSGARILVMLGMGVGSVGFGLLVADVATRSQDPRTSLWSLIAIIGFLTPEILRRFRSLALSGALLYFAVVTGLTVALDATHGGGSALLAYQAVVLLPLFAATIGGARAAWYAAIGLVSFAVILELLGVPGPFSLAELHISSQTWLLCALATTNAITALAAFAEHTATEAAARNAAHAVRNPLAALRANVDLAVYLVQTQPSPNQDLLDALQDARESASRIVELTGTPNRP